MATSEDILIADEIVTAINAEAFSMAFTAERMYVVDWDIKEELGNLQCGVWPADADGQIWERDQMLESFRVGVSFAKRVSAAVRDDLDDLMDLVTEVKDFLALNNVVLGDGRTFHFTGWEYLVRFDEGRLDRNKGADGTVKYTGVFGSAIVLDYQGSE